MVKILHPQGTDFIREARMEIRDGKQQLVVTLPLFDDGGALHPEDGDVFARDSIFTNQFDPRQFNLAEGEYSYQFSAVDKENKQVSSEVFLLSVVHNTPPRILNVQLPDTLYSGVGNITFSATVEDDNGNATIKSVIMRLFTVSSGILLRSDSLKRSNSSDSLFLIDVDSTFSAEKKGTYLLKFQAVDEVGDTSVSVNRFIYLQNLAPHLGVPQLPDSFQLPSAQVGSDTLHLGIRASDPQGNGDIDSVYFQTRRPDGGLAGGGAKILLFDDGNLTTHGDMQANDGKYSVIISITSQNQPGDYVFIFNARDKVGNRAKTVQDTITIYP